MPSRPRQSPILQTLVSLIEFLALPQSQWVTAQTLFINGGYLAR